MLKNKKYLAMFLLFAFMVGCASSPPSFHKKRISFKEASDHIVIDIRDHSAPFEVEALKYDLEYWRAPVLCLDRTLGIKSYPFIEGRWDIIERYDHTTTTSRYTRRQFIGSAPRNLMKFSDYWVDVAVAYATNTFSVKNLQIIDGEVGPNRRYAILKIPKISKEKRNKVLQSCKEYLPTN